MEKISFNFLKFFQIIDNLNPRNSGILFSILFHLTILLFAVGIPNFFGPKDIYVPNIIPIEILNVSENTNFEKSDSKNTIKKDLPAKQKKFNSSENTEIQKQYEVTENIKTVDQNQPIINIKEKEKLQTEQKKIVELKQKEQIQIKPKTETIKTNEIKPKLKPKPQKTVQTEINSDVQIQPKTKKEKTTKNDNVSAKPKPKPKEDFSIASMLKDLRNDKSNNAEEEIETEDNSMQTAKNEKNENMVLSISEIDLLRQQLSSCWNAPAGAIINVGDKVTISAKIQQNMKVFENSVRIVDTNISKSNPFYGPITDSAMRTLLNPECTPLKLPKDKFKLWKNLTITFDYSIMKGY